MNKEIKLSKSEIIGICEFLKIHHFKNSYLLLDCITDLQEENERLNTELNAYKDEFCKDTIKKYELVMEQEDYKVRCEKAIEYIEQEAVFYDSYDGEDTMLEELCERYYKELLKKLNGGDEQ